MSDLKLVIEWSGPYSLNEAIESLTDAGEPPEYDGEDYGLYQIYGRHIINGPDTLLYVGKAAQQTFADRFRQHESWLRDEDDVCIYVGRVWDEERHADSEKIWETDVDLAEKILIHKYSPNYNSASIAEEPDLPGFERVELTHRGERNRLQPSDTAPDDF